MAKVTITIEDKKDGTTSIGIDFDPPLKPPFKVKKLTPAQRIGYQFIIANQQDDGTQPA